MTTTSSGVTFSGMALDRAPALRSDSDRLAQALRDPSARMLAAGAAGVAIEDGPPPALARRPVCGLVTPFEAVLLGLDNGDPLFAMDLEALEPAARATLLGDRRVVSLREAGAILSHAEAGLAAYLVALLNWHRTHPHCSVCGARTMVVEGGYARRCPVCGATHFPRTDPAVIVLVHSEGRVLLGRHAGWPERQYSILAGFVSPGESLEEAVAREVLEESGITVHDPQFVTSQPWPFPSSLMVGFEAASDGGDPVPRDGELEDVRWFSMGELRDALTGGSDKLLVPPGVSIARFLLERWCREHGGAYSCPGA